MGKRAVIIAISLVALVVVGLAAGWLLTRSTGGERLIIATSTDYPPFGFADAEGNPAGFDYEYGKLLCQKLGVRCEWRTDSFENVFDQAAQGEFDLTINSYTRTAYREQLVHFSDPYYYSFGQFVRRAGSNAELETSRVVAVQEGTIYEKYLGSPAFAQMEAITFPTQVEAFQAVSEGRADLTIADDVIVDLAVGQSPFLSGGRLGEFERVGDRIIPQPGTVEFESLGTGEIGIIVPKQNAYLLPEINRAIMEINMEGEMTPLSLEYFGRDITAGPGP